MYWVWTSDSEKVSIRRCFACAELSLDRLGTVAGRADELCRYAVLFGDPQLALTALQRVLEVTPQEVQEVAKARLRPDNRAVLVYEPLSGEPAEDADPPEDPEATVEAGDKNEDAAK